MPLGDPFLPQPPSDLILEEAFGKTDYKKPKFCPYTLGKPTQDSEIIGCGECRREDVKVVDDDDSKIVYTLHDHPVITLEDGNMICGIECWWIPLAEFITTNQGVLPAYGG